MTIDANLNRYSVGSCAYASSSKNKRQKTSANTVQDCEKNNKSESNELNEEEIEKYLGLKAYFDRLKKVNRKIKALSELNFDARNENPQFIEPRSEKSYLVQVLEKYFSDFYESHLESGLVAVLRPKENSVTAYEGIVGLEGIRERLRVLGLQRFIVGLNCGQIPNVGYNRIIISDPQVQ